MVINYRLSKKIQKKVSAFKFVWRIPEYFSPINALLPLKK